MSKLVAAMACSHAPPLLRHLKGEEEGWERLLSGYRQLSDELAAKSPDVVVVITDDHLDNFFLDKMPTFAVGAAPAYDVADEGFGGFWNGHFPGHEELSRVLAAGLVERGFDLVVCHGDVVLDHGVSVPLPFMCDNVPPIVPVIVNSVVPPYPTPSRCWMLGRAIRAVLDGWDADVSWAVLATGGMSHQLSGPDFGMIDESLDRKLLGALFSADRASVANWTVEELLAGGDSAVEVLNWIVGAGVAGPEPPGEVLVYEPLRTALTGMAVARYEID